MTIVIIILSTLIAGSVVGWLLDLFFTYINAPRVKTGALSHNGYETRLVKNWWATPTISVGLLQIGLLLTSLILVLIS